jgi:membrane protease YdiL (CAAX protease family)
MRPSEDKPGVPINNTERQSAERQPYPGFAQAIWLLLLFFIILILIGIPSRLLVQFLHWDSYIIDVLRSLVASVLVLWYGLKRSKAPFGEIFPFHTFSVSLFPAILITVFGASIVVSEIDNLVRIILPMPPGILEEFINLAGVGDQFIYVIVFTILLAPVTEEMLFRGLLLRGFSGRYSARNAILLSAVMFGIWHLNPWQFFGAVVHGIFLAWWFVNTGSLIPCIVGHALNNALPLFLVRIVGLKIQGYTLGSAANQLQPVWFDALGVFLFAFGIFWALNIFRRGKNSA